MHARTHARTHHHQHMHTHSHTHTHIGIHIHTHAHTLTQTHAHTHSNYAQSGGRLGGSLWGRRQTSAVESEFDANQKEGGDKDTWIDVAKDFASRIEVTQKGRAAEERVEKKQKIKRIRKKRNDDLNPYYRKQGYKTKQEPPYFLVSSFPRFLDDIDPC